MEPSIPEDFEPYEPEASDSYHIRFTVLADSRRKIYLRTRIHPSRRNGLMIEMFRPGGKHMDQDHFAIVQDEILFICVDIDAPKMKVEYEVRASNKILDSDDCESFIKQQSLDERCQTRRKLFHSLERYQQQLSALQAYEERNNGDYNQEIYQRKCQNLAKLYLQVFAMA